MPDKRNFTPAGWATELNVRFYRAAMRKAGIDLDKPVAKEKFEKAVKEWAKTPVPAKILPTASKVAASEIAAGRAKKRKPEPKVEPIKVGEK